MLKFSYKHREIKSTAEFGTFQGRSIMNSGVSKTIKSNPATMLFTKTIDVYGYYNQYTNSL